MKTLLTTAAALVLGLATQAVAFGGDGHGRPGRQYGHTSGQNQGQVRITGSGNGLGNTIGNNNKKNFAPIQSGSKFNHNGSNWTGHNGTGNGKHTAFKDYKGPSYQGKHCNFWSKSCFNQHYGCNTYWCPRSTCWFYWCQPYGCYLPVDYCPTGCYVY